MIYKSNQNLSLDSCEPYNPDYKVEILRPDTGIVLDWILGQNTWIMDRLEFILCKPNYT